MNIFAIDPDPQVCARYLDDKRLNKMIVETAQMLSTAIRVCHDNPQKLRVNGKNYRTIYVVPSDIVISGELVKKHLYVNTHANHPCTVWARESRRNYVWLLKYFLDLLNEYYVRKTKIHACDDLLSFFWEGIGIIPKGAQTEFPNCATYHKHIDDVYEAYKQELAYKWLVTDSRPAFCTI